MEKSSDARFADAAGWHLKLNQLDRHGAELSAQDVEDGENFYASPDNREAVALAARVAAYLDARHSSISVDSAKIEADDYDGSVPVSEWLRRKSHEGTAKRRARTGRFAIVVGLALAASVAVVVINAEKWHIAAPRDAEDVYRTETAQNQQIRLPDGSTVVLGGSTEMAVHFADGKRSIRLEKGEALFTVAHDRNHPFIVEAGNGSVTAVGTEFNVRRNLELVTVTVTEGSVLVAPTTGNSPKAATLDVPQMNWQPVHLQRDQELTYDDQQRHNVRPTGGLASEWTAGRFQYRDVPLRYVVADLNRYRKIPILIQDTVAGEYGFTGTVFLENTGEWLLSLQKILPLHVSDSGEGRIRIESIPELESTPPGITR
jgi:transmembrane sensor